MSNSTKTNLTTRKSLLTRVKGIKKRTMLSLAGIFMVASGGYYEVKKLPLVEISYVEQGNKEFLSLIENSDKKGLILFYTDYCYPCEQMNDLFRRKVALASMVNQSFVPYKVDAFDKESGALLREKYNIDRFPTLIVTDKDGSEIDRIDDADEAQNLIEKLSPFAKEIAPLEEPEVLQASLGGEQKEFYVDRRIEYVDAYEDEIIKPSLALSLDLYDSYDLARSSALLKTKIWKNEIWIEQTEKGKYMLILGQFDEEQEVLMAQNYLKSWEGMESEVHELSIHPQKYN